MRYTKAFPRTILLHAGGRFGGYTSLGGYEVERFARWGELLERAARVPTSTVLLLEPHGQAGSVAPEFWEVLGRFRSLTVIAAVPLSDVSSVELRRMQMAGVSEFLNLRLTHSPEMVARLADTAFARPLKQRVDAALSRFLPGDARALIRGAAEVAACAGSADDLARIFGVQPPTVTKWCEALRLPPPRRLQLWLRLLLAAQLLEDVGRSIQSAARSAGYATDRSFRRALQEVVGKNPRELRARGAFDAVMAAFNAELREFRGQRKHPAALAARGAGADLAE
ncbi:MAG TPA: helix-turn-helix domain-containing protein [Longimicrobium sp.]|nr:helix-turn-helix domain-containing protein [Longimicrobium sp.]